MKVVGINGSSRKNGNTAILIKTIFEKLHDILTSEKASSDFWKRTDPNCAIQRTP